MDKNKNRRMKVKMIHFFSLIFPGKILQTEDVQP